MSISQGCHYPPLARLPAKTHHYTANDNMPRSNQRKYRINWNIIRTLVQYAPQTLTEEPRKNVKFSCIIRTCSTPLSYLHFNLNRCLQKGFWYIQPRLSVVLNAEMSHAVTNSLTSMSQKDFLETKLTVTGKKSFVWPVTVNSIEPDLLEASITGRRHSRMFLRLSCR